MFGQQPGESARAGKPLGPCVAKLVLILGTLPLAVSAQSTKPVINAVVNAASYSAGPVAPGEMVVIFGSSMGPPGLVTLQLDKNGNAASALSGVQVLFTSPSTISIASPLVYVSASQIAAMVPYSLAGAQSTTVWVFYGTTYSSPFPIAVAQAAPGIFSSDASGKGQGAIANSDGSLNSSSKPAAPGSYVTFYLTGMGQTTPPGSDGSLATTAATLSSPVSVQIGGQPAQLLYAGAAPGNVDGFAQINAVIPTNLPSGGSLPLVVQMGGVSSQSGLTIAVTGSAAPPRRTVVLIHGIGQGRTNMSVLNLALSDPVYGIDLSRFTVDSNFDWTACANFQIYQPGLSCPSYCSLEEGAAELANYIASKVPPGHIILLGYSMGGLLARDLILNNRNQILGTHPVDALITLGTPNVGYPGEGLDDALFCTNLVTEMSSDWRSQQAKNSVVESTYLYQLNSAWTAKALPAPNLHWLAAAGTFCSNPVRNVISNTGCRDSSPYNDGIVCADSADFNLTGINLPTVRWNNPAYAHTNDIMLFGATLFGGCNALNYPALDQPPHPSPLLQELRDFINAQ